MTDSQLLDIEPSNPSRRQVFLKSILGLIVGVFISFLVFLILLLVGGIVQEALASKIIGADGTNPLLPLILLVIAFLGTFIGCVIMAGIYNLIFTEKYYDMSKMFGLVLFANIIVFVFFIGLYLLFAGGIEQLFFILAFHIIFTVFLSFALIEMSTNPNYSAVHLIGTSIGLLLAVLCFGLGYKIIDINAGRSVHILLSLPPVLAYFLIPFWHGLWEKVYRKFYEAGNNFFYIPSLSEVMVDEEESDDVAVELEDE
ncbi:MAG: hypothetical protein Q8O99_05925 [bacterium]|nr:hypothetical protein [bacterium]